MTKETDLAAADNLYQLGRKHAQDEIAEEIAKLKCDKERLDWLAYHGCAWRGCEKTHKDWRLDKGEMWIERYNGSLREALDAAMTHDRN